MKRLLLLFWMLAIPAYSASFQVTQMLIFTNTAGTTNGMTFTEGTDTRTFTNNVVTANNQVLTNTSPIGSAGNLYSNLIASPLTAALSVTWDGGTNITIIGIVSSNLVGSVATVPAGGSVFGQVTNTATNTVSQLTIVTVPMQNMPVLSTATNMASLLATNLGAFSTNYFPTNSTLMEYFVDTNNTQTIGGAKTFLGAVLISNASLSIVGGTQSNTTFRGQQTNTLGNIWLDSPTATTGAIMSGGSQLLMAYGTANLFAGVSAGNFTLTGSQDVGLGYFSLNALTSGQYDIAIGADALVSTTSGANNTAIGAAAMSLNVTGYGNVALGTSALLANTTGSNNVGIGYSGGSALTTGSSNIDIANPGNAGESLITRIGNGQTDAYIAGVIHPSIALTGLVTNSTLNNNAFGGTNNWGGDVAYSQASISSLANGNNTLNPSTNIFVTVSGPTAAFSIASITSGRSGRLLTIENATGFTMSILNDSGFDTTAANRVYTGTSNTVSITGSAGAPGMANLIYDGTLSHWVLQSITTTNTVSPSFTYTSFTNGTTGAATAFNTYYTNTFGTRIKVKFMCQFTDQVGTAVEVGMFQFSPNSSATEPPFFIGYPAGVATIATNYFVTELGAGDYVSFTNTTGTAAAVTNRVQY